MQARGWFSNGLCCSDSLNMWIPKQSNEFWRTMNLLGICRQCSGRWNDGDGFHKAADGSWWFVGQFKEWKWSTFPLNSKGTKGCLTFQAHVSCVCGGRFVIRAVNLSNWVSVFDVTQKIKNKKINRKTRWRCELFYRGRIQHILIWITVNFFET